MYSLRAASAKAAAGAFAVSPIWVKPRGSPSTRSPWDIHTASSSPGRKPWNRSAADCTVTWARPYSRFWAGATLPPKSLAVSCAP